MNNLFTSLYDNTLFFEWDIYQYLLACLFDNTDYGKFGWLLLALPLMFLVLFYKVWEPMRKQRLMWVTTIIIISIIGYAATTWILYSNNCILNELGAYSGDGNQVNPEYFIFQISMLTVFYSIIFSLIYTLFIKRFSKHNSHNPF